MTVQLFCGDCLEVMKGIESESVDAIITDPPYGTTACKWDSVIPFAPMWEQLKRIIKPNGAIVLFGSQPFTSALIMSNVKMFKYEWIWQKETHSNFLNIKKQPGKRHENICVFYEKQPTYNPQFWEGKDNHSVGNQIGKKVKRDIFAGEYSIVKAREGNMKYPISILPFNTTGRGVGVHPTQKPVALLEYLIKTYTNEGETVLDFTAGSGSTGVACVNTNRNFIGIEKDEKYFEIAKERIAEAERRKNNESFVRKPDSPTLFDFMLWDKQ